MSYPMPTTPSSKTTWSWQFLPSPADMAHIRNCGRNLNRWSVQAGYGFRAGTTELEQTRILAARALHNFITPPFRGRIETSGGFILAETGRQPWTMAELRTKLLAWMNNAPYPPVDVNWPTWNEDSDINAWFVPRTGFGDARAPFMLLKFLLTLNNGWGISAAELDRYSTLADAWEFYANGNSWLLPLIATQPWQIAQTANQGEPSTLAAWQALTPAAKWLCETRYLGRDPRKISWHHGRDPYKSTARKHLFHALSKL